MRIIPVRKTPQGQELKLADLLDPMDKSVLKELQAAIAAKDAEAFRAKYEQTLNSCYACHVAAGKPFLRLQIPSNPRRRSSALPRNRKVQRPVAILAWGNEGRFKLFVGCGYLRCFRECKSRPATMRAEWVQARYPHASPFPSAEV